MPDGRPAPALLTLEETIRFLRIEGLPHPENCLRYYLGKGKLHGTRIGKCRFFAVGELCRFIEEQTK